MKKSSVRVLALSCLSAALIFTTITAQAQTSTTTADQEKIQQEYMQNMTAVSSANAAAAYTGNPALTQQVVQPGQAMLPQGMQQTAQPMMMMPNGQMTPAYNIPGQSPVVQERPVIMSYDKKDVEGFYGVPLPARLFDNVPSDW